MLTIERPKTYFNWFICCITIKIDLKKKLKNLKPFFTFKLKIIRQILFYKNLFRTFMIW